MSSLSGSNYSNSNSSAQNVIKIDNLKLYVCPKCNRHYDYYFRNGTFLGRVPLILQCNHTMCEECIRITLSNGEVTCVDCRLLSRVVDCKTKSKLQELFPVNLFLLGNIYYHKPNHGDLAKLSLKPTGVSVRNRRLSFPRNEDTLRLSGSGISVFQERCCQQVCNKAASLRCFECNEVYCQTCSHLVHKAARGLQTHKITTLEEDFLPELTEKCKVHLSFALEFYCKTCEEHLCCYCIVQNHSGHIYHQLSFLNDTERPDFDELIQNAELKLKRLLLAYQKTSSELNNSGTASSSTTTENEISKYFALIHARLQCIEANLQKEANEARNSSVLVLNDIASELAINIRNLSGLLTSAKTLLHKNNTDIKLNIKVVVERLENALRLPCYLDGQHQSTESLGFEHVDLLANLENGFMINFETTNPFCLLTEDSLPDDYDTSLPDSIAEMSIDDINQMIYHSGVPENVVAAIGLQKFVSPSDILTNALLPKETDSSSSSTIETWVHNTTEELKNANTIPHLKTEDRENIVVTYIESPECFYVQLVRLSKVLNNLSREIDQHIRRFAPVVNNPELNKLYIVKYEVKHSKACWYRARVIDISTNLNGQDQYRVHFIDYGNSSIVSHNMVREISSSLAKPKPFALQCKLMYLYPVGREWDAKAIKLMAQIISRNDIIMVVLNNCEGILEVDLIAMPHGASVRDALIFVGDAVPCSQSTAPLTELTLKSTKPLPKFHKRTELFQKGQIVDVLISHVIDPYNVYIQIHDFVYHISHLSDVMANYYNNKPKGPQANLLKNEHIYVPKKDMIVAVRIIENCNSIWYRGIVTEKYDGKGIVDVFLVDVGKSVTVSYTNIRKLVERFRNLECLAILVKMANIKPQNKKWDVKVLDFFNKYILNKQKLRMLAYDPLKTPPDVLLFETYGTVDVCINALMTQEHLAQMLPGVSLQMEWRHDEPTVKKDIPYVFGLLDTIQSAKQNSMQQEGDEEEEDGNPNILRKPVDVLSAKGPDLIYVSFKDEVCRNDLQALQVAIQDHYSRSYTNAPPTWKENDICVVINKENKMYYRAIILKIVDVNKQYEVLLRDTAEEITVNLQEIFILEDKFKNQFEGAIRCHMSGIIPAGDTKKWSLLAIEFLQNVFQNQNQLFISKDGITDKERKSLCVEFWYSEFRPGAALEPSKTVYHSINKLLTKNGLALRQRIEQSPNITLDTKTIEDELLTKNDLELMQKIEQSSDDAKEIPLKDKKYKTPNKKKERSRNLKTKKFYVPITTNTLNTSDYLSNDAILHPRIESVPHECTILQRPRSVEANDFITAINKPLLTSLSTGNSPVHKPIFPSITNNDDAPLVKDWYELVKLEENAERNESDSESVTDWLPPVPFTDSIFYAHATFVDDNAHIYLHDIKYQYGLKEMEANMKAVFDNLVSEPIGTVWVPGQICTVKYYVTNNWYRGKIVDVADDHIKVFMVDFGNTEECKHEDLRFKVMYTNLPIFGNKIQLHRVFPKNTHKWLTSDLDELHKSVVDKTIYIKLKGKAKPNCVPSAVVKVDNLVINEYIIQRSENLAPLLDKSPVISDTEDVVIEGDNSEDSKSTMQYSQYAPPNVTYTWKPLSRSLENKKVPAGVVNILNFNQIIIEFAEDENAEAISLFEAISKDINKRASQQPMLRDLQIGQACVAQFSEDGEWYRGQVYNLENLQFDVVEIWFVDFGNFETVPKESVREIHPDWLQLPVQQYIAQLYRIELNQETFLKETLENMGMYCNSTKTIEIIGIEPLIVQLYENDELCYKDLIERNILNYKK